MLPRVPFLQLFFLLLGVLMGLLPLSVWAEISDIELTLDQVNVYANEQVRDRFPYSGLAQFYNGISLFVVTTEGVRELDSEVLILEENQWLAIVGHYKVLVFQKPELSVMLDGEQIQASLAKQPLDEVLINAHLILKSELKVLDPTLDQLRYAYLWTPLRVLCLGIDKLLLWLNSLHPFGWGITIVLLSILFKIFILPGNILLMNAQRKISYIQARLAPDLDMIKANYSSEEAHEMFMAAHKRYGVTPFFTLKSLPLTLLSVPFSIAIFNVLGEIDQIEGHSFLWINDLVRPDSIYDLGFQVSFLGSSLNFLPILMTLLTIFAAILHQNKIVSVKENQKQKKHLYLMALGLFVLFYPFPAAMVLYWTCTNLWQLIQHRIIKI